MAYEPIGRIRPVAPTPSLLTSARPLSNDESGVPVNWSTGVSWIGSCINSEVQPYCPNTVRGPAVDRTVYHTMPFVIHTPVKCNYPVQPADLEQLVMDATEVHTPAAIARALWMGDRAYQLTDTTQPTLRSVAFDVSPVLGGIAFDDAVATLLTHYQLCTGGNGGAIIHMPGSLLVYALGGGSGGARVCWPEGNVYRGPHGCTIVAGPGYPEGRTPPGPGGSGPIISPNNYWGSEVNSAWMYVTGPVEYAVSAVRVMPESEQDRSTFRTNLYEVWGERDAIVRFDPCCVFATEVISPAPMPEVS